MAVSQTGEKHGSMRTLSSVSCSSFFQLVLGADDLRMIVRIAERLERDERIEHRRKNRGQPVGAFKAFEHPLLGLFQRAFAERMDAVFGKPFGELVQPVEPEEKIAPVKSFRVGREREVAFVDALGIKLVEVDAVLSGRVGLKWLMMASGTSMARDQLLMSQKFTWNHLPMRSTSHGMVGTYSHGNRPSSARYSLENVFMRGTPPRFSAISRARNMRGSVTGTPASFSARYALMVAFTSDGPP